MELWQLMLRLPLVDCTTQAGCCAAWLHYLVFLRCPSPAAGGGAVGGAGPQPARPRAECRPAARGHRWAAEQWHQR